MAKLRKESEQLREQLHDQQTSEQWASAAYVQEANKEIEMLVAKSIEKAASDQVHSQQATQSFKTRSRQKNCICNPSNTPSNKNGT